MAKPKKAKIKKKIDRTKKIIVRKIQKKKPAKIRKILVKKVKPKTQKKKIVKAKKIKKIISVKKKIKKPAKQKIKKTVKIVSKIVKEKKAPTHHKKRKRALPQPDTEFASEALFKAKIKVVGIGGGGGSIVSEIGRSLEKATFVIADTDIRALKKKNGIKYFWFGQDLTHGLGTGVNVDLAKQAAESSKEKIGQIFKEQDIIIFIASLGGGLGSGATQVFADVAKDFGGITVGIFTMPFKFEGKNKQRIAQNALKYLRQSLNVSLVIPNEKIFKIIGENTPITTAFSTVNKNLIESLESLIDLIYNPGVINIDFADLRTILKGRGNSAFLNTIEESGKDRVEKICEKIFVNPLLQNSNLEPEKILFNIAGSESLSMFEVEKISSHIANLNPKAKIIFGISKNAKLKNKIKTTILMTGAGPGGRPVLDITEDKVEEVIEKKSEVKKAEAKEKIVEAAIKTEAPAEKQKKKKSGKNKKEKTKISSGKPKKNGKIGERNKEPKVPQKKEQVPVSFLPVFEVPVSVGQSSNLPILEQRKMEVIEATLDSGKKTIRRSGLEIRKAEEQQEKKRVAQEKEWEIPAFLRKVKFKS